MDFWRLPDAKFTLAIMFRVIRDGPDDVSPASGSLFESGLFGVIRVPTARQSGGGGLLHQSRFQG